ncbi:hypothetical protein SFC65_20385 [Priestia filamentosa]|uniref:hypothetical protein n=1 Tax=Priestia filamentosa TaxID=1402861 RepID=UPI003981A703
MSKKFSVVVILYFEVNGGKAGAILECQETKKRRAMTYEEIEPLHKDNCLVKRYRSNCNKTVVFIQKKKKKRFNYDCSFEQLRPKDFYSKPSCPMSKNLSHKLAEYYNRVHSNLSNAKKKLNFVLAEKIRIEYSKGNTTNTTLSKKYGVSPWSPEFY